MKMGGVEGLKSEVITQLSYGWRKPMLYVEIHKEFQYLALLF
jgi:hypothetical protein